MDILFVYSNLYGHINPTLGLVKELTQRGIEVSYFCAEDFSENVTSAGAGWIGFSDSLKRFLKDFSPSDRHPFFMLIEYMLLYDENVLPDIISLVKKNSFDMLICDSYFGGVNFLKEILDIPVLSSFSSFAMSSTPVPDIILRIRLLNRCLKGWEI